MTLQKNLQFLLARHWSWHSWEEGDPLVAGAGEATMDIAAGEMASEVTGAAVRRSKHRRSRMAMQLALMVVADVAFSV